MKKTITITVNGVAFEVSEDIAKSISAICSAMGKKVSAKAETKAEKPKSTPKSKATKGVTIAKVDRYGNQWLWNGKYDKDGKMCTMYDPAKYATKKAEMITNGTYDAKNRGKLYKELGWIL